MSGFTGSPRLLKGALVVIKDQRIVRRVIVFQYNPETLTRSLRAKYQTRSEDVFGGEPLGLKGPPAETIRCEIELDATDRLELGVTSLVAGGVYPGLAALEALLYPDAEQIVADEALLAAGAVRILPAPLPLVLFAWGPKRVVPVRISTLEITEQAFDTDLSPILAKVSLSMEVLTYQDLGGITNVGGALSLAHHIAVEVFSDAYTAQSAVMGAASATQSLSSLLSGGRR